MSELLTDPRVVAALVIVVVLPLLIVFAGEVEERLRQRDSMLTSIVSILRRWAIPLLTVWTIALGLFGWPRTNLVVRLIGTALLLTLGAAALAVLRLVIVWVRRRPMEPGRRRPPQLLLALPRVLVIIVTAWVLLSAVWGVDLSSALTALGVTSLVVSFALQDTLSGLASGLLLLSDSPFQPGDWIKSGDIEGRVIDINWRSSRIASRSGDLLVVPNAQLAGAMVVNYDQPTRLHRVVVPVQVAYVNPPTLAKEMLLDAARSTPGVLEDPPPVARVVQVDDPLMGYEVHLWIDDFEIAPRVASDFGSLVWYQSHRHDVPLPSPAYDLFVYDGLQAGESGRPNRAEVRRRLRRSPLLDQLGEDDIERLAASAHAARFAAGEVIFSAGQTRDLYVMWQGSARIEVAFADGVYEAARLSEGDIFGILTQLDGVEPRVTAVSDCEVVVVGESAAGEVASRNPDLAGALNRLASTRRRRLERIAEDVSGNDGGASEESDHSDTRAESGSG
jgi:small-conductance mechanosensitive channel/CRP-like cAMP-binding protein